jgi:hypothetical protein
MRANTDRAPGVRLVTDPPGGVATSVAPDGNVEHLDFETDVPTLDIIALAGRITAGLGVQLLITAGAENRRAFITLCLDGETETFEVAPEHAMDAYRHPFCYGGTLL